MIVIKKFQIPKIFIDNIKNQAYNSYEEIYGWLIGYIEIDIPKVLAIFECTKFEQQTVISAMPNVLEFQEISSILPQGIGPIGIYHSHPVSSEIFHSHTDDSTLSSLTNQFQHCVSIVTNGKELKYYQMGKKRLTKEIDVEFYQPEVSKFILLTINEKFGIQIDIKLLDGEENLNKLKVKIRNLMINYFQNFWDKFEFLINGFIISKNTNLNKYFSDNLEATSINLKIPEKIKKESSAIFKIDYENQEKSSTEYRTYQISIRTRFPVYIIEKNMDFGDIKHKLKVEILGNILVHKLHYMIMDDDSLQILIPNDHFLRFFGFYVRTLNFNQKNLNEIAISGEILKLELKMIRFLKSFIDLDHSNKIKESIIYLLEDLKELSQEFNWKDEINEELNRLKLKLLN